MRLTTAIAAAVSVVDRQRDGCIPPDKVDEPVRQAQRPLREAEAIPPQLRVGACGEAEAEAVLELKLEVRGGAFANPKELHQLDDALYALLLVPAVCSPATAPTS